MKSLLDVVTGQGAILVIAALGALLQGPAAAEESATQPAAAEESTTQPAAAALPFPPFPLPEKFFSPFDNEKAAWVWINLEEKSIITFGRVCSFAQPIELTVCQAGGKSHESILETFAAAQYIHTGALLLRMDAPRLVVLPDGATPTEAIYDTAVITVEWLPEGAAAGAPRVKHRLEELVLMLTTEQPMQPTNWLFIGSYFSKVPKDWRNKNDTVDVYAADYFDWGIVTTYNTPGPVFDNPFPEGQSDELFYANTELIPPAGTIVMLRFTFGEPIQRKLLLAPDEGHKPGGEPGGAPTEEVAPEQTDSGDEPGDPEEEKR